MTITIEALQAYLADRYCGWVTELGVAGIEHPYALLPPPPNRQDPAPSGAGSCHNFSVKPLI